MGAGFFLDRNTPKAIGRALALVRPDIHVHDDVFGQATPDEEIVAWLAEEDLTMITRDITMTTRLRQRLMLMQSGIHSFHFVGGGNATTWATFQLIVKFFPAFEGIVESQPGGIFTFTASQAPSRRYVFGPKGEVISTPKSGTPRKGATSPGGR